MGDSAMVEELEVKVHNNGVSFGQVGLDRWQKNKILGIAE